MSVDTPALQRFGKKAILSKQSKEWGARCVARYIPAFPGPLDPILEKHISTAFDLPPLLSRTLIRRGIIEDRSIEAFLEPGAAPLQSPFAFPEMEKAIGRIHDAVLCDENICIYGDYDADGVCATAILLNALRRLTDHAGYYIPSRHTEGYGINYDAIRKLKEDAISLIITVDNGIASGREIAYAGELGIDVIVTDHHEPQGPHPVCAAVLSAADDPGVSPLCGAGVAMKLALALLPDADPMDFMPLAAIATVADMVPLIGENRTIVALGLPEAGRIKGVSAILKAAGIVRKSIDETAAAFCIAPRLNASGRMDHASGALSLLISEEDGEAERLASSLENLNRLRREQEMAIYEQAREQVAAALYPGKRLLTAKGEGWNVGIVGIVASRLVEEFHMPAIVFSENDGILTGSGRSIPGVNLFEAVSSASDLLVRFGGHAMAAGITVETGNFDEFSSVVQRFLSDRYDGSVFTPTYYYEEKVSVSDLPLSTVRGMERLSPFGEGNDLPVFLLENIRFDNPRPIGKEKQHLTADVVQNGISMRMIAFSMGRFAELLKKGGDYDAIVTVGVDSYRGSDSVQVTLRDFRRHPDSTYKLESDFFKKVLYNSFCVEDGIEPVCIAERFGNVFHGLDLSREAMGDLYKAFGKLLSGKPVRIEELIPVLSREEIAALAVFIELGFFDVDAQIGVISAPPHVEKRDLNSSSLYRWMKKQDDQ